MNKEVDLNQPLIKSESGLLVNPSIIENKQEDIRVKAANLKINKYNERYKKNSGAPTPNVAIPYSFILTKATPPKLKEHNNGLLIQEKDVDERMAKKLEIMSENVSDEQEVLLTGPFVKDGLNVSPGDYVKINYNRFRRLHDNHTAGVIETEYEIPLYVIDGNEYLLIDARDVLYSIPKIN